MSASSLAPSQLVDLLVDRGASREGVVAELVEAGRAAVERVFGSGLDLEVEYDHAWPGVVRVRTLHKVVETVTEPRRQVSLAVARAMDTQAKLGDTLVVSTGYHDYESTASQSPMPAFSHELGEAMTGELVGLFARHGLGITTPWESGAVGDALASSAGWLRGWTHGSVTIERTFAHAYRRYSGQDWDPYVYWGFVVRHRDQRLVFAEDTYLRAEFKARFAESPEPAFREQFTDLAANKKTDRIIWYPEWGLLVSAMIAPASSRSLVGWCREELPRMLAGFTHESHGIKFTAGDLDAKPQQGWLLHVSVDGAEACPQFLPLGQFGLRAGELEAPTGANVAVIESLVSTFSAYWRDTIDRALRVRGVEQLRQERVPTIYRDYFELLPVIEGLVTRGPAPSPPVAVTELGQPGAPLCVPSAEEVRLFELGQPSRSTPCFAEFRAGDFLIGLSDDLDHPQPFFAPSIVIVDLSTRQAVSLIATDPLAEKAWVIDGDAWAYACFTEWLRTAIVDIGRDLTITYARDEFDTETAPIEMKLSDWLLMGWRGLRDNPWFVDWRVQSTQVESLFLHNERMLVQAAGDNMPKVNAPKIALYRRFLAEVIHPGFSSALRTD